MRVKCRSNALWAAPKCSLVFCRDLAAGTAPGKALKYTWSSNGHRSSCAGTPQLITGRFETEIHIALSVGCFSCWTLHTEMFLLLKKKAQLCPFHVLKCIK